MANYNDAGQVTLILRSLEPRWRDEYFLNLLAAFATNSNFSHIEMAIGDAAGQQNQMCNVLRIFNDNVGVELCQRTGKSPNFKYLQIGCSRQAEQAMLRFAMQQQKKPFSMNAMARSIFWPRKTDYKSYFCAELVAATLQAGGLMSADSNPGAATPQSLYEMYAASAAVSGNPCTMRSLTAERATSEEMQPLLRRGLRTLGFLGRVPPDIEAGAKPQQHQPLAQHQHQQPPPPSAPLASAIGGRPHGPQAAGGRIAPSLPRARGTLRRDPRDPMWIEPAGMTTVGAVGAGDVSMAGPVCAVSAAGLAGGGLSNAELGIRNAVRSACANGYCLPRAPPQGPPAPRMYQAPRAYSH